MSGDAAQQEIAAGWIAAMPSAQLAAVLDAPGEKAVFGYSIPERRAREIGFEAPEGTRLLPAVSCLHTVVIQGGDFAYRPEDAFEAALSYCQGRGFAFAGPATARVLLVETDKKGPRNAYIDVYVPIS